MVNVGTGSCVAPGFRGAQKYNQNVLEKYKWYQFAGKKRKRSSRLVHDSLFRSLIHVQQPHAATRNLCAARESHLLAHTVPTAHSTELRENKK